MEGLGRWAPMTLDRARSLLERTGARWWIAGGWAIDLFVGAQTRAHGDLDVAMLRRDQEGLAPLRSEGWDLQVAADGVLTPWTAGDWLEGGARHQIWARPGPGAAWALEILFEEADGEDWLFRRDGQVHRPLTQLGRRSPEGLPYIAPEVVLLYKAKTCEEPRNAADFAIASARLDPEGRRFLGRALGLAHPGHPWIGRLEGIRPRQPPGPRGGL